MASLKRKASAVWNGDGMTGKGALTTQSGVFKSQPYSFKTRFGSEDGKAGTNPEELVAAAHAACFSMALSFILKGQNFTADEINTEATVEMEQVDGQFAVKMISLDLKAKVPGIDNTKFQELATLAKKNCPISKALAAVTITLKAQLI